jgi:hypothetical protein
MRNGRLLALDTPSSLKAHALPGVAWDVILEPVQEEPSLSDGESRLLQVLKALQRCPCVLRAGLISDHLRAITPFEIDSEENFQNRLQEAGIQGVRVERVEPTLEDVFLALAI